MDKDSKIRRRRRTCMDQIRRDMGKQRRSGPAGKAMLKLLDLLSAILAIAPPMPEIISVSGRDRRLPPSWYPNDSSAWARERGLEPEDDLEEESEQPSPALRPKATASWSRLVKDLDRRSTRDRARELIETRVPAEALDWLREMVKLEDWITLRVVGQERTKDEIREFALLEAMKWQAARMPPTPPAASSAPDDTDDATPPGGLKPK